MKVGFIGLGSMGTKMAKNLIKNKFDLTVYNRTKYKEEELIKLGAKSAHTLADMGNKCHVVVTCLPNDKIEKDYIFGKNGLLDSQGPSVKSIVSCSTIDVKAAEKIGEELRKKDIYYFDSPVSGGPKGAEEGILTIMVGGDEDVLNNRLMPVYKAMGKNILYFGKNGSAQKIKLINQIMTWVNHAVICEAAVLAKKAGLDENKMYDALMTSYGYSKVFEVSYKSHIQPENYENPTGMKMMVKDLLLAQKFAEDYGALLPMTDAAMNLYNKAIQDGHGEKDQSIIMEQLK